MREPLRGILLVNDCPLCNPKAESVVWQNADCRVILVDEPGYPGFCRVVWTDHVAEMTDLQPTQQQQLFALVMATERALRSLMQPDKINIASLGNWVPHLHWHVIPRFRDDPHFPDAIWSTPKRSATFRPDPDPQLIAAHIDTALTNRRNPVDSV